jgi:hypothetical protein
LSPEEGRDLEEALVALAYDAFTDLERERLHVVVESGDAIKPLRFRARLWLSKHDFDRGEEAAFEMKGMA